MMKLGFKTTVTEMSNGNTLTSSEHIATNTLPEGFEDITSIKNIINIGSALGKDYKWIRRQLQAFDFDTLTDEEKLLVAQYKATTETNCKNILGESYNHWMSDFDEKSVECRSRRFSYAKTIFLKNVSLTDRYTVLGYLNSIPQLKSNYVYDGIEGTSEGDPLDGFFNFIEATNSFAETGIAARTFTMLNGVTKEEMVTEIMDCLRNGNY